MSSEATVTSTLVHYITNLSFEDLPGEVIRQAKLWMLDSIGCGLGGSQTPIGKTAVDALSQISSGAATVIGRSTKVDIATAALLNAMSINALDFDDADPSGHPSSTIIGTLLALCTSEKSTGRDLLLSYVAGFEASSRIGQAIAPSESRFGEVFGLGTHQTFGAVTAAAKLLNLNQNQTLNAYGIAGASAPVPSGQKWGWDSRPLTWMKDAVAVPAQAGVTATMLASAGFHGCRDILDGDAGFWRMAASDQCDFDLITRNLGSEFFIMNSSIKTYACCWFIHPTLDAVKAILEQYDLSHEDIAAIDVWSMTDLYDNFNFTQPHEMVDVQFSLPYCVALVLLGVPTGPEWVIKKRFSDAATLSIASQVTIHPDADADHIFHNNQRRISARVKITTNSCDVFEAAADAPRGTPGLPVTEQEIIDKYLSMALPVLGSSKAQVLLDFVLNLDSQEDLAPLAELIAGQH